MEAIVLENLAHTRKFCVSDTRFGLYSCEMSIHTRIKQRRIECGFTSHKAFAKAVGVVWQTVQQWEKEGGTAPNRNRIEKVAEVLNTTPEWLMTGEGDSSAPSTPPVGSERGEPVLQWIYPDEAELLGLYRAKADEGKNSLLVMARALANSDQAPVADPTAIADRKAK